jgi:hypothetical protein
MFKELKEKNILIVNVRRHFSLQYDHLTCFRLVEGKLHMQFNREKFVPQTIKNWQMAYQTARARNRLVFCLKKKRELECFVYLAFPHKPDKLLSLTHMHALVPVSIHPQFTEHTPGIKRFISNFY